MKKSIHGKTEMGKAVKNWGAMYLQKLWHESTE